MKITIPELLHKIANAKSKDLLIHQFLLSVSALLSLQTIQERQEVMNLVKLKLDILEKKQDIKNKLVLGN